MEELARGEPAEVVRENARRKALAVPSPLTLGADTVVAVDGRILAKPAGAAQAREWLGLLSGRTHQVHGGVCVLEDRVARDATAVTDVTFRRLDEADIDRYLATGEWCGRAGGYAIQGRGAALVRSLVGDYLNVVGLPVVALIDLLPSLLDGQSL